MTATARLLAPLLALTVAACGADPAGPGAITSLPRDLSLAEREVVRASNAFAFDLLREVRALEEKPNVFVSPLSASMALGMTLNGAENETYAQMRDALRFGELSQQEINAAYRGLLDLLRGLDRRVELEVANSTWARQGFDFQPAFFAALRESFDAEARELDFGLPAAKDTINEWVDRKTRGRIDSIVDQITPDDVLFLLNAVYFKGDWATQFDPKRTSPASFRLDGGGSAQVDMMSASDMPVALAHVDGATIGELRYGRGAFAMVVVLPPSGASLAEFTATVDDATWSRWMAALGEPEDLNVRLPKFELEYETQLNEPLQALGMRDAFVPLAAEFGRMTRAEVYISEVKQKTFLKVDEVGTEAAAVTSVGVRVTSMPPGLYVDRPFLLAIRERFSGAILFLGLIGNPAE